MSDKIAKKTESFQTTRKDSKYFVSQGIQEINLPFDLKSIGMGKYKFYMSDFLADNDITDNNKILIENDKLSVQKGGSILEIPYSRDLENILFANNFNSDSDNNDFRKLVRFVYPELKSSIGGSFSVIENDNRKNLLHKKVSYNEMAKSPITFSLNSDGDEVSDRLSVLLGSINSGQSNISALTELSSLLDVLLKRNVIDKAKYKIIYKRAKEKLEQNNK